MLGFLPGRLMSGFGGEPAIEARLQHRIGRLLLQRDQPAGRLSGHRVVQRGIQRLACQVIARSVITCRVGYRLQRSHPLGP